MIDLHSHILPGIDDGAADLETSLAMARLYVEAGFRYVVATPHAIPWQMPEGYAGEVIGAVGRLNRVFVENGIVLKVLPGMEVAFDPELPDLMRQGAIIPLAAKNYVLLETPFGRLPLGWSHVVFELGAMGYTVLFAHPERCDQVMRSPEIMDEMVAAGAKLQVTWDSFSERAHPLVRRLAIMMAEKGRIHCLATDSHDPAIRRPNRLLMLYDAVAGHIGSANLDRVCRENPLRVIEGRPVLDMDMDGIMMKAPKKHRWWRWRFHPS